MSNNIGHLLEARVAAAPDKTFLFSEADGRSWTYAEFDRAVNRTANLLRSYGIGKGEVVSLLMPNSAEYLIAYFACWKMGALAGPINSLLKNDEIAWVVNNSESKLILVGSDWSESVTLATSTPTILFDNVDDVTNGFGSHSPERGHPCPLDATASDDQGHHAAHAGGTAVAGNGACVPTEDDDAIIIYTSGTTGKPKGCLLTHGNLVANARQITEWMGFDASDRLLTMMPLFHMNAVSVTTMTALYAGGSTVVSPKFSASRFWETIEKYKITSFGSVATMLSILLERGLPARHSPAGSPRSLRFVMCGSAPVPAELLRRFEEAFECLVIEGYGLSESTCRSTFNPPNQNRRPGSCGQPIGNEMKIFDDEDHEMADGELGEIVLRGENIFRAYYKNTEATEKAFTNGWFHTGDIGYRDAEGFFYIADRKSDMIIRGGENIYPREIDDLLYTHPAIAEAAVIGIPDELYGEEVAAFVVLREGSTISEDDLVEFCRKHFAEFKCPKSVRFLDEIPKGPTGKLLKRELTKIYSKTIHP